MKLKKVLLNLMIIAGEVSLLRFGYGVLADKYDPIKGCAIVIGLGIFIVLLTIKSKDKGYRWKRPGLWKTTALVAVVLVILSFFGYNPLTFGW